MTLGKINAVRDLYNTLIVMVQRYEVYQNTVPEGEYNPTMDSLKYFVEYLDDLLEELEKKTNDN